MINCKDELLARLRENYLYYKDEISLLTDGLPEFIRNTLEVNKLSDHCYCITYLFFGRSVCYALSFDGDSAPILDFLQTNPPFAEVHTNLLLGNTSPIGQRNLYGSCGSTIVPTHSEINGIQIVRFTSKEIELFESLQDELSQSGFDSYDLLRDGIASGQLAVFGAVVDGKCLAYTRINSSVANHSGKSIIEPTVYTAKNCRKQGVAATLLTTVFTKYYADCDITYGVDAKNISSNGLAQTVGLNYLGTKYRYTSH
ncbi:MAG: hypothetical protein IJX47_00510 [Clostridia bacterium]|nr:hypothetical protein [Clostridia bacterium]